MTEYEARRYAVLYAIVRDRLKAERDANSRTAYAEFWWRFGEARRDLRSAMVGLDQYIVTPETAKHRLVEFLSSGVAPDNSLIAIASADSAHLGVLSSSIHATWALAAGSRLGIDGTPRCNKGPCFEAFPFPEPTLAVRAQIAEIAERIDKHRKDALTRNENIGMTAMYNVIDRLRTGEPLSDAEREVHRLAACGTLRDLHDELDRTVAEAYGWAWPEPATVILERLVALHDARVEEEKAGRIRWLRPEYQVTRFAPRGAVATTRELVSAGDTRSAELPAWPTDAVGQITALRQLAATSPVSVDDAVKQFSGAPRAIVARHLETLAILGEVHELGDGRFGVAVAAAY